jgi:hypothetical protein
MTKSDLQIIGRVEKLAIINGGIIDLPAKIDTGAYSSAVWATEIVEDKGELSFILLGPKSPFYTGEVIKTKNYDIAIVQNSFGQKENRYGVTLNVELAGRKIRSRFTLANRALKSYPALIGRRMLNKRFIVDVSKGGPIQKSKWR